MAENAENACKKRNALPVTAAYIDLAQIFGITTKIVFGLEIDLEVAARASEVVDERTTERARHGRIQVADIHAETTRLLDIHFGPVDRHIDIERREHPGELRPLRRGLHHLAGGIRELLRRVAAESLQVTGEATGGRQALYRRQVEGNRLPALDLTTDLHDLLRQLIHRDIAIFPWFHGDEDRALGGIGRARQDVETGYPDHVIDPRDGISKPLTQLLHIGVGPCHRGSCRQADGGQSHN